MRSFAQFQFARSLHLKFALAIFGVGFGGMFFTVLVISDRVIGAIDDTATPIPQAVLREDLGDAIQLAVAGTFIIT